MPTGGRSQEEEEREAQDRTLSEAESTASTLPPYRYGIRLRSGRVLRRTLSFDGVEDIPDIPPVRLIERFGTADPTALRLFHNFRTPQRRIMADKLNRNATSSIQNVSGAGQSGTGARRSSVVVPSGTSTQEVDGSVLSGTRAQKATGAGSAGASAQNERRAGPLGDPGDHPPSGHHAQPSVAIPTLQAPANAGGINTTQQPIHSALDTAPHRAPEDMLPGVSTVPIPVQVSGGHIHPSRCATAPVADPCSGTFRQPSYA